MTDTAEAAPGEAGEFNAKIIDEFRAHEGRIGGPLAGVLSRRQLCLPGSGKPGPIDRLVRYRA